MADLGCEGCALRAEGDDRTRLFAHDIVNLLTVITLHAHTLGEELPEIGSARDDLTTIVRAAWQVRSLLRQLVGPDRPRGVACAPREVLGRLVRPCEVLLGSSIRFRLDGDFACRVPISEDDLTRIVLNLVKNAQESIAPGVGTVRISLACEHTSGETARACGLDDGEYLLLSCEDDGRGMTEEVRARAFDRDFSTKGALGSGLGLHSVRSAAVAAGGGVSCESSPGLRTRVVVWLPRLVDVRKCGAGAASADLGQALGRVEDESLDHRRG